MGPVCKTYIDEFLLWTLKCIFLKMVKKQWWLYLKCNYIGTLKWPAMGICYVTGPEVLGERNNLYKSMSYEFLACNFEILIPVGN